MVILGRLARLRVQYLATPVGSSLFTTMRILIGRFVASSLTDVVLTKAQVISELLSYLCSDSRELSRQEDKR